MGNRIFNMSQGSTYIENQTNYIQGNQVFGDPKVKSSNSETACATVPKTKMELLVMNHPDPAAFIAQLKLDVAACDTPKEKMRVVNKAIEARHLPEDLPYPVFCEEIEKIAQSTFSTWLSKSKSE